MSSAAKLAGVVELSEWIESRDVHGAPIIDEQSARDIVLRSLGRKGSSRWELDRELQKRGVEPDVRQSVLDELASDGVVDDARFAAELAERLRGRKRMGERGVAAELRRRGLDPDVLDPADSGDELERAIATAADRRRRASGVDDAAAERRLAGYLSRRGFGGGVVKIAIERTRPKGPRFR